MARAKTFVHFDFFFFREIKKFFVSILFSFSIKSTRVLS